MKLARTVHFNPALVALVPFVTVVFLVLMFFVLSTRFVLQPGIAATLPYSPFILGPQHNPQILSITAIPVPTIYFRDQKLSLPELENALSHQPTKERTLVVKADRGTPYELVVSVMNLGLQQGYSVVLATSEQRQ
jgi:biopolymer transport protein ExbD